MKFQSVFIIFNILLIFFLGFLCLFPLFFLDDQLFSVFWGSNWYLFLIIALIIAAFDVFFLTNRRLYSLLEREDWPALVHYIEDRVLRKGKYSPRLVRILANTYLVLSDSAGVISLENKAGAANPGLVDDNALVFGTARILGKDISGAVRFFEARLGRGKAAMRQWISWYYGFSLLLNQEYENASREFSSLARTSNDGVISGLSAYFLGTLIAKSMPEHGKVLQSTAAEGRARVLSTFPQLKNWTKETTGIRSEIHTAVLAKYMEETGRWIYAPA